jgi:hypothetical protein
MKPVEAALPRSAHFVADWHTGAAVDDWHPVPFDERIAADRYLEEVSSTGTTIPAQVFVVRRDDKKFGVLVAARLLREDRWCRGEQKKAKQEIFHRSDVEAA